MNGMRLLVSGSAGAKGLRPVKGGVPLAEGAAHAGTRFHLTDAAGQLVPLQAEVLATWPEGSARWVLLDFLADPPAGVTSKYTLTWSEDGATPPAPAPAVQASAGDGSLLDLAGRLKADLVLEDGSGRVWRARPEQSETLTDGPLRATRCVRGSFRDEAGTRWFDYRLYVTTFAGLSQVLLEPLIIANADQGLVQRFRSLRLSLRPADGIAAAALGGGGEQPLPARLFQVDDRQFQVGGSAAAGRMPGWAEATAPRPFAVAVRDFWQQWPKALSVTAQAVEVELFPRFEAGAFDHMGPWFKHDYLFEGDCYRLRTGQSRRWQVWVGLDGGGAALAESANAPLVVAADPRQALQTGVWGPQRPAGTPGIEAYDRWAEQLFDLYRVTLDRHRDYGAMNWGDWWGERRCNWGNHEYDTPLHMFVQFARTGAPRYFHLGDVTARHMAEVDVVHAANDDLRRYFEEELSLRNPTRAGMVHQHTIGHVGGFHPVSQVRDLFVELYRQAGHDRPNPYLCLEPNNLGHVFTQGLAYHYLLTGDPWTRETLEAIGNNLCGLIEDRQYAFKGWDHCGRVNGWTMLALAGCHDVAPSPRFLAAMRSLADDALEEQDPHCGGWLYELPWGHCYCTTRKHVGEAGFISAVRVNGLSRYYELTGDERIPEVVRRAVTHLNNDTWREEHGDWRYTSCPQSMPMNQFGVIMMALRNAVVLGGDAEHLRILRKAWQIKFARLQGQLEAMLADETSAGLMGKDYGGTVYGCGETVGLLASLEGEPPVMGG